MTDNAKKDLTSRECFLLHLKRRNARVVPNGDTSMLAAMAVRSYLAEATEHIDYGCDFREGKCTRERKKKPKDFWSGCCCNECFKHVGYFEKVPEAWMRKLVEYWDPHDNGFWSSKHGCRIPRFMRPSACLAHQCGTASNNRELTKAEYLMMCAIRACRI